MIETKTFKSGSSGNLHLITSGTNRLLLECGLPIKKIKEALDFDLNLDACLLSHCHMDHAKSAQSVMDLGIDLVCSEETAKFLKLSGHRLKVISGFIQFGVWKITPFPTIHDTPGALCFLIEIGDHKILFATDTASIPYQFDGLTHLLIECNHSSETFQNSNRYLDNRIIKTHMSLDQCLDFLKRNDLSKVQEIRLIHLSDRNSDAEYFKREVQKLTGKHITIG